MTDETEEKTAKKWKRFHHLNCSTKKVEVVDIDISTSAIARIGFFGTWWAMIGYTFWKVLEYFVEYFWNEWNN